MRCSCVMGAFWDAPAKRHSLKVVLVLRGSHLNFKSISWRPEKWIWKPSKVDGKHRFVKSIISLKRRWKLSSARELWIKQLMSFISKTPLHPSPNDKVVGGIMTLKKKDKKFTKWGQLKNISLFIIIHIWPPQKSFRVFCYIVCDPWFGWFNLYLRLASMFRILKAKVITQLLQLYYPYWPILWVTHSIL